MDRASNRLDVVILLLSSRHYACEHVRQLGTDRYHLSVSILKALIAKQHHLTVGVRAGNSVGPVITGCFVVGDTLEVSQRATATTQTKPTRGLRRMSR